MQKKTHFGPIWEVLALNNLEGQGQMPPYTIPSENYPRYTFILNLVITVISKVIAWKNLYLQTDGQTERRTDRQPEAGNENTPLAQVIKG